MQFVHYSDSIVGRGWTEHFYMPPDRRAEAPIHLRSVRNPYDYYILMIINTDCILLIVYRLSKIYLQIVIQV